MKAVIIYLVSRGYKIMSFYKKLQINGFKTDAPYNAMYFRRTICKGLIRYFAGGP